MQSWKPAYATEHDECPICVWGLCKMSDKLTTVRPIAVYRGGIIVNKLHNPRAFVSNAINFNNEPFLNWHVVTNFTEEWERESRQWCYGMWRSRFEDKQKQHAVGQSERITNRFIMCLLRKIYGMADQSHRDCKKPDTNFSPGEWTQWVLECVLPNTNCVIYQIFVRPCLSFWQ